MIRLLAMLLAAAALVGCAAVAPGPARPRHVIGLGFESLVGGTDWGELSRRLSASGIEEVSIAVGRLDWLAYPPDRVGLPSGPVRETGRDYVAEAIAGLDPWRRAALDRRITLTIDALIPGLIAQRPELAAVDADGTPHADFASVTALQNEIGDSLVALTEDVARRYGPDEVAVTELLVDHSFGDDDLDSFIAFSGADDWPRRLDGSIDTADAAIGRWRSAVVADLAGRMADRSRENGVPFAMDVRVDWDDPARGRPDSGHDYGALIDRVDRLTLWCYTALGGASPEQVGALPGELAGAGMDVERMIFSVGMWTSADGVVIGPDHLRRALESAETSTAGAVGVTPLSLLEDMHWSVIETAWR